MTQKSSEDEDKPIKLIALGETGVGKTSILSRFNDQNFSDVSQPTLGCVYLTKKLTLQNNKTIKLHIWDTAGQQKYRSIVPIYYHDAQIAICVYDITSERSFQIMKKWIEQLQINGPKNIILAIVGNKIDRSEQQEVKYSYAKEYAESLRAILKLVSAKQGKNIKELFTSVTEQAIKKRIQQDKKKLNEQNGIMQNRPYSKLSPKKQFQEKDCC